MRELLTHLFEEKNIPSTWMLQTVNHTYERGALRSGSSTGLHVPLPEGAWNHLRVEMEIEPIRGAVVDCGSSNFVASLVIKGEEYPRQRVSRHAGVLATNIQNITAKQGISKVIFEFKNGAVTGMYEGVEYIRGLSPVPELFYGYIVIAFYYDCMVHSIRILGGEEVALPALPPRKSKDFFLDMAVDFYDDIASPEDSSRTNPEDIKYSRAMYEEFFTQLKRCGVRRIPWNYHDRIYADQVSITDELNIGDNFELAVEMAHKHGMEIFGTIKPFETLYFERYAKAQPGFLMARKPDACGAGKNKTISRIDIVKEDAGKAAFGVGDISLFVSDDNKSYQPYTGKIVREEIIEEYPVYEAVSSGARKTSRTRRARVLRLDGLKITHPYLAFTVPGKVGSFTNDLVNLVHLFGEAGRENIFTYGMASNTIDHFLPEGGLDNGIAFDVCHGGTPTFSVGGFDAVHQPFTLDSGQGFLGFNRYKAADFEFLGSPSFPETREWWLAWVRAILEAGADGVEIRQTAHPSSFTWGEFGFEQPVRDEFLKRTGVDIWKTDDFDKPLWRKIRGEGFTEFCREASVLTRKAGKKLGLHIGNAMDVAPEEISSGEIHWDWRTWINEGMADYLVLKGVKANSLFGRKILSLARPKGIDVVVSQYLFMIQWNRPGWERYIENIIRDVRDSGADGVQFYDSAALLMGSDTRQRVIVKNPALRDVLAAQFGGE